MLILGNGELTFAKLLLLEPVLFICRFFVSAAVSLDLNIPFRAYFGSNFTLVTDLYYVTP